LDLDLDFGDFDLDLDFGDFELGETAKSANVSLPLSIIYYIEKIYNLTGIKNIYFGYINV
jgi:hypothetical protein